MEIDKRILGFAGPTSSMHYIMRMEEKLLDAGQKWPPAEASRTAVAHNDADETRPSRGTSATEAAADRSKSPTCRREDDASPSRPRQRPRRLATSHIAAAGSRTANRSRSRQAGASLTRRYAEPSTSCTSTMSCTPPAISSPFGPAARCEPPTITMRSPFAA